MSAPHVMGPQAFRLTSAVAGHRGSLVVVAATLTMALGFGGIALISVFMAPMEAEFGWTRSDTSLGYAFSTTGMAIGGLIWGRLSDRIDIRALLLLGATGMVSSLFAMALLRSLAPFYAASLIYGGFGFSVLYSPLLSTSGDWFPSRRGLVTGIVTAGGAVGQGVLPFVASSLILSVGWRAAFALIASVMVLMLALLLPMLRWPHGTQALPASPAASTDAGQSQSLTVALLSLAAFMCCVCMGVPLVHMATFIGAICASPTAGVSALLVAMMSGAVGRICIGVAADRIGALTCYAIASAMQTVCVVVFPFLGDSLSFMVLSAVFGVGFAGNMTCLALCIRQAVPANRFGGALGAAMMVAWAGMAVGGYAGGVLFDATLSYTLAFMLAGLAGLLNLAILALVGLRNGRRT